MEHGVPQLRVAYWDLYGLAVSIHVNDIPETAIFVKFILYANDANIILTDDTIYAISC